MSSVRKSRVLDSVEDFARLLTPQAVNDAAQAADDVFRRAEKELFSTEGGSGGERWVELSPAYKAQKDRWFGAMRSKTRELRAARKGPVKRLTGENKILQLTGSMKRGLSTRGENHIAQGLIVGGKGRIRLGIGGPAGKIATYHFNGGKRLPIRKPIQISAGTRSELAVAIQKSMIPHVMAAVRAAAARAGFTRTAS